MWFYSHLREEGKLLHPADYANVAKSRLAKMDSYYLASDSSSSSSRRSEESLF